MTYHPCMKMSVLFAAAISAVALSAPAHADDLVSEYGQRICDAQRQPDVSIGIPPPRTLAFLAMQKELVARGLNETQMFDLKKQAIIRYCPELRDF
jgi:hypothetical protein